MTGRRWLNRYRPGLPPGSARRRCRTCTNYFIGAENCYSCRRQLFLIPTIRQPNLLVLDRMRIGMSAFSFLVPLGRVEKLKNPKQIEISCLSSALVMSDVTMIRRGSGQSQTPTGFTYLTVFLPFLLLLL